MNYIGKETTNIVSVCNVGGKVYYNIDFIGNFKASEMKLGGKYVYVVKEKPSSKVTDDTIILEEETNQRFHGLGRSVTLSSPVHIKKSYERYKWLDENGFIGPDDTLILQNRNQFSLYKDCIDFIEKAYEYVKAEEYRDRMVVYKFHKYGIDGIIKKQKDGQGEIKFNIPGGDNKISFGYYVNGRPHDQRITNYRSKELTKEDKKILNEINKIIVSLGLKEIKGNKS